jgi:hypothetical protein
MFQNFFEKLGMGVIALVFSAIVVVLGIMVCSVITAKVFLFALGVLVVAYIVGSIMYKLGFRLDA